MSSSFTPSTFVRGIFTALMIAGSVPPLKSMSTTGPMTCTMTPWFTPFFMVTTFVEDFGRPRPSL
jgi:hypothetical protein